MTSPVVPRSCTGTNRLGRPCTNRVASPEGWCGKCQAPAPRPAVAGNEPPAASPPAVIPPLLELPAPDESWSPAEQVRRRLAAVAGDSPELQRLVEVGARLAANSRADKTKASYRQHWLTFERFCAAAGLSSALPVPPEVVAPCSSPSSPSTGATTRPPVNAPRPASRWLTATCARLSPPSANGTPTTASPTRRPTPRSP